MTDLKIYRGDNKTWVLTFKDSVGAAIDITGYTIFFTVKNKQTYIDSITDTTDGLIQKTVTSHTTPASGISALSLVPADTSSLAPTNYIYDMQLKDGAGKILTFIEGNFEIIADVTRRSV